MRIGVCMHALHVMINGNYMQAIISLAGQANYTVNWSIQPNYCMCYITAEL